MILKEKETFMKWLSEKLETSAHRRSCGEAGLGTQHT
jgi:hypothetical protein